MQKRVAVIVCSVGRPDCVMALAQRLSLQSRLPDRLLIVVPSEKDAGMLPSTLLADGLIGEVVISPKGLPRQRNAGLDALGTDCDLIVFFDDDFIPSRRALAGIERGFEAHPEAGGLTGVLIADGINGPGISEAEADVLVSAWDAAHDPAATPRVIGRGLDGLYGCNMAYRMSAIGTQRFDEALPLYGWQEDIDFAARIDGDRIKTDAFAGVHRGIKSGRETAGHRLGYSQVVNPWYLVRKGTMRPRFALRLALRNVAANHVKALRPEPWIDRQARLRGNWIGLMDIVTMRARPDRILSL